MASTESGTVQNENLDAWYRRHEKRFEPPVCNCLMYYDQLKVMYVTGPNIRKDYHLEEGEELFYQVKGEMVVHTWEHGQRRSIVIKEGELWHLPARVPHSPNRFANTLGLVIERLRLPTELDALRYYAEAGGKDDLIFQEVMHVTDLGVQLAPVINRYLSSEAYRSGVVDPAFPIVPCPVAVDEAVDLHAPFSLQQWLDDHREELERTGALFIFDKPEIKMRVRCGALTAAAIPFDKLVWVYAGTGTITTATGTITVTHNDHTLIPAGAEHTIHPTDHHARLIEIWQEHHHH
jgi:3-hydroxyanthranilate 3,4-dioxygenase